MRNWERIRNPKVLDEKARKLGYNSYGEYIDNDFYWHTFSQTQLRDTCFALCNTWGRFGMVVHHVNYERMGQELPEDVVTLCYWCHRKAHQMICDEYATLADAHLILRKRHIEASRQMAFNFDLFDDRCNQPEAA